MQALHVSVEESKMLSLFLTILWDWLGCTKGICYALIMVNMCEISTLSQTLRLKLPFRFNLLSIDSILFSFEIRPTLLGCIYTFHMC